MNAELIDASKISLEGKVAIVTGAARMSGIGRSIALALAGAGADVALSGSGSKSSSWPEEEIKAGWRGLDSVADEIRAMGRRAEVFIADLRSSTAVDAMVADVVKRLGRVDILINNAAAPVGDDRGELVNITDEAWMRVIDVKLNGAFYASRAVAREFRKQGQGGRVVNISSIGGKRGAAKIGAYGVANAGLQALGASLARDMATEGVTVNSICVGATLTARIKGMQQEGYFQEFVETVPMKRAADPSEIANVAVFLCSPQASYITAQSINVDGGALYL
ncbi:MAG TPA: SDR family NAD(P)-dependent oxidoreductase [Caulobacteraceae bacterium]|nr:SDR family NAD(P)-dependent oxidoreductase [Caulobacteraceae bacterium]